MALFYSNNVKAQYTEVGQNSFSNSTYGPAVVSISVDTSFSRHAYIYRKEVLGALQHGDTIRSLEFFKSTTNVITGKSRFRIYLDMSSDGDFGFGNINWTKHSADTGCRLVFEGDLSNLLTGNSGFHHFDFNRSDGKFAFDTTRGTHLKILVEFIQYNMQQDNIPWAYENNATVPQFRSNNETKYIIAQGLPRDSTNNSNVRKPYIRINFPRYAYNLNVHNVYALGKIPRSMRVTDTIKVLVSNDGLETAYNKNFYLNIEGSNSFKDTATIDSLAPYKRTIIKFFGHIPKSDGKEVLTVLPEKDNYAPNDTGTMDRLVNFNVYAHTNPFRSMDGGVGFNDETGDFLAKFYSDTGNFINQISVEFFSNNLEFQLGIWEVDTNGRPGKELFMSDTLLTKAGSYILPVLPRVKIGKAFFVGLRQLSLDNLAYGFQFETPIRPDVFYFTSPAQNTQWTPFSPGYDYNCNIQPRIQVANDVSVVRAKVPEDGEVIELSVSDSIAPKAVVHNFGFKDQNSPFDVVCEIRNSSNQIIYKSTRSITIDAGDSLEVVFDSTFRLYNLGLNTMLIYTRLSSDFVIDNDTVVSNFEIVISHDVAIGQFFAPVGGETFQLNRDSVWPIVRILNNGIIAKNVVKVNLRVYQGSFIISNQVRFVNLEAQGSDIVAFDTIVLTRHGEVTFEASVYHSIDSFRSNDTLRVKVNVIKDDDVAMINIIRPQDQSVYATGTSFKPFVDFRNVGRANQDSVYTRAAIYNSRMQLLYKDSMLHNIAFQSTKQALFKNFTTPGKQDTLTAVFWINNEFDQDHLNDTIRSVFYTAIGNDLLTKSIDLPLPDTLLEAQATEIFPKATYISQGLKSIAATSSFSYFYEITREENNVLVYYDSVGFGSKEIVFGESVQVEWDEPFRIDSTGNYSVKVWHNYIKDELTSNDTLEAKFTIARLHSIVLAEVIHPQEKAYEVNATVITPEIRIVNNGLEDIPQFTTGEMIISKDQQVYYTEDFVIGGLNSQQSKNVVFESSFKPTETGTYNVVVWLENVADEDKSNDTARFDFDVYLRYDVTPVKPVFPSVNDTLAFQSVYQPSANIKNSGDSAVRTSFSVSFQIFDGSSLIYNSNRTINQLEINETKTVLFDSSFTAWFKGEGTSMVITRFGLDQNVLNDTLIENFIIGDPVGIKDHIKLYGVSVYPNPVRDILTIELLNNLEGAQYTVAIYSSDGVEIMSHSFRNGLEEINMNDLAEGMYFLRIIAEDGRSTFIPVVKN